MYRYYKVKRSLFASLTALLVVGCLWFTACQPQEIAEPDKPCLLKSVTTVGSTFSTTTSFDYNAQNQVVSETISSIQLSGTPVYNPSKFLTYKYDSLGFLISKKGPYSESNGYVYENKRLIQQWYVANTQTVQKYVYNDQGKIVRYEYNRPSPNQQFNYWYDFIDGILVKASGRSTVENGRLEDEYETPSIGNAPPINFRRYSYDEKGRMTKEEFIDGKTQVPISTKITQYDDALTFIDPLADTYRFKGFPLIELRGKITSPIRTETTAITVNVVDKYTTDYKYKKNSAGFLTEVITSSSSSQNGVATTPSSYTTTYIYTGCK